MWNQIPFQRVSSYLLYDGITDNRMHDTWSGIFYNWVIWLAPSRYLSSLTTIATYLERGWYGLLSRHGDVNQ